MNYSALLKSARISPNGEKFEKNSADFSSSGGGGYSAASNWTDTSLRGYAGATSINKGEAINLYVGTTLPSYTVNIYREGWYGGVGSRLMQTISNLPAQNQPVPSPDPTTGLLELNWNVSYTLQTDSTWTKGI